MAKPKNLDQLQAEKEQAETQLAQEQHKLERLENRKKYLEKGERTKRTHRLCNLGGTVESLAPEVKDLTRTEMTELMEHMKKYSRCSKVDCAVGTATLTVRPTPQTLTILSSSSLTVTPMFTAKHPPSTITHFCRPNLWRTSKLCPSRFRGQ